MARKGRKRKPGQRAPSGRLRRLKDAQQAKQREKVQTVLEQPHRKAFPEERRTSQNLEDELGRMYEAGLLLDRRRDPEDAEILLAAGRRYQRLLRTFHQVMVAPITTRSAGFAYVAERVEADPDHDPLAHLAATETAEERQSRICWDMDRVGRLFAVLPPSEGRQQRTALDAVCLHDQRIAPEARVHLLEALSRLAWLWRMFPSKQERSYAWRAERFLPDETQHEKICGG